MTPQTLAALANPGLVKRAQRELETAPPTYSESEAELQASFPDGTVCRFPVGKELQSDCSCGAKPWCRHRIAAILAYSGAAPAPPQEAETINLEALQEFLGPKLWKAAEHSPERTQKAQVSGPPWTVHLATCTVQFLGGNQFQLAKCNCRQGAPCHHLALAGWAISAPASPPQPVASQRTFPAFSQWLTQLLQEGCEASSTLTTSWASQAATEASGCTWLLELHQRLLDLGAAYSAGATAFSASEWAFTLLNSWLRIHHGTPELWGTHIPLEQELSQIRLISLGYRITGQRAQLYWAEPSGQVLVQHILLGAGDPSIAGLGRLSQLGQSQIVSQGVKRRANRTITFSREKQRHSRSALGNAWLGLQSQNLPSESRLTRPLVQAEDLVVVEAEEIDQPYYDPGQQCIVATLNHKTVLRCYHRPQAPTALDRLQQALQPGCRISGFLHSNQLDPIAVWNPNQSLVILDQNLDCPQPMDLEHQLSQSLSNPLTAQLQRVWDHLAQGALRGTQQLLPSYAARQQQLVQELEEMGMLHFAQTLQANDWIRSATFAHLALERTTSIID